MKIAVPVRGGEVDSHFGHCEGFSVFTLDERKAIVAEEALASPAGCGCKSGVGAVLAKMGVTHLVAGNMGEGAVRALASHGIAVTRGAAGDARAAVERFAAGTLADSGNRCAEQVPARSRLRPRATGSGPSEIDRIAFSRAIFRKAASESRPCSRSPCSKPARGRACAAPQMSVPNMSSSWNSSRNRAAYAGSRASALYPLVADRSAHRFGYRRGTGTAPSSRTGPHRVAGSLAGRREARDLGPERGAVTDDRQAGEPTEAGLELRQARIVHEAVGAADTVTDVEGQREPHGLRVPEKILHQRVQERQVRHHLAQPDRTVPLVPAQPEVERGVAAVGDAARIHVAEGQQASPDLLRRPR